MKVSVVIPTYNRYEVLRRAVASVFKQTHVPDEVIIIDDGSNDKTQQIAQEFPQIQYFFQENAGVSSARNLGIEKSSFEWIAFLDSDDEWDISKIKEQLTFHQENPKILMSYTEEEWIRDGIKVKVPKKFQKFEGEIFQKCLSHCIIAPSATLIHKDLLHRVGKFDENLEVCEDYDLWLRIARDNKIGLIKKKLTIKYAGHEEQLSFKYWGMDRFRVQSLEKLLQSDLQKNTFEIKNELIKKYTILLKGAKKYNKDSDITTYKRRLQELRNFQVL